MLPVVNKKYDFDIAIHRSDTDSIKWSKYHGRDVLPLWVADMDFQSPPQVIEALENRVRHGVFGYGDAAEGTTNAVTGALMRDYNWKINSGDFVWLPGIVSGLNLACRALSDAHQAVITAFPTYSHLFTAPAYSMRKLIEVPLTTVNGRWEWDWDLLESRICDAESLNPRLLLLCHPHNPVGRMWTRSELNRLLKIVIHYNLLVCSDEIHCDLILEKDRKHIPFASLGPEAAARTLTLMAPSKTYNLSGLGCAFAVAQNPDIRERLTTAMKGIIPPVNVLGLTACGAAYQHGAPWRSALLDYLRGNRDHVTVVLGKIPELKLWQPEATYLFWIDCRKLCSERKIDRAVDYFEAAGVGLSDGAEFGAPGYVRLNFGCTRSLLNQALERMISVL